MPWFPWSPGYAPKGPGSIILITRRIRVCLPRFMKSIWGHWRGQRHSGMALSIPLECNIVQGVYVQACIDGIDLRSVPEMLERLTLGSKIEDVGYFPTIPLH